MPDQANQDREAIADVQADGGDGCGGSEGDTGTEGGEGEAEGEESGEPDCIDGRAVPVDAPEDGWDPVVSGEGEHHARVAGEREEAGVVDAWRMA